MSIDLSHRGGVRGSIRPEQTLFQRIGGSSVVGSIVDGLYDRIEVDSKIRPMFLRNLEGEREKQKAFWEEWLGGEPQHTHHHAYSGLQSRHAHLHITLESAETWLAYLKASLDEAVDCADSRKAIVNVARPLALAFVNEVKEADPKDLRCRRILPFRELKLLAEKGKVEQVAQEIASSPDLLDDAVEMAEVLQAAVSKGRTDVVSCLLESGVDPNRAAHFKQGCIFQSLMLTPLCVALVKGQGEIASRLREAGAIYDVFTSCYLGYLGDIGSVQAFLDADAELANTSDPACDVLEMTPLHHAVYGGHLDVVRLLFERGAEVGVNSGAMVRYAANNDRLDMVRMLIDRGADATRVGPGLWVLNNEIASLLMSKGADVNYPAGEWIWRSCTGNNSQRDNPDLVSALIDHGANIHTILRGATALHFAAKAGFFGTVEVLLNRGADPDAPSESDEAPLLYALKAGKRSDITSICRLLISKGADPETKNKKGVTPLAAAARLKRDDRDEIIQALKV